jgi:hypothetical protein
MLNQMRPPHGSLPAASSGPARRRARTPRAAVQLALRLPTRGGRRPGAGRKPKGDRAQVSHRPRGKLRPDSPVHVTLRLRKEVTPVRSKERFRVVARALHRGSDRLGLRVVHYSVQANHVHLVVQADDGRALGRGMQGLCIRLARALNAATGRHGRVFADRFHSHVLHTPREVRQALAYVLNNARKHAAQAARRYLREWIDPFSSGAWFDGWAGGPGRERALVAARRRVDELGGAGRWVPRPRGWLLTVGWRRRGLIELDEIPGA